MTLTSLAPGSVAQVVRIEAALDVETAGSLARGGLIAGTHIRVASVDADGSVRVRAARDEIVVPAPVAGSIHVVPGDLAEISDRVARDAR